MSCIKCRIAIITSVSCNEVSVFFNVRLIFNISFFVHFRHCVRLESSSITYLATTKVKNARIVTINKSNNYFPIVISFSNWSAYYNTLLHCFINLEDVIFFVISFFESHYNFRAISSIFCWYICKLNSLNVVGLNFPFKVH